MHMSQYHVILFYMFITVQTWASRSVFLLYHIFVYHNVLIHFTSLSTLRLFPVFPGVNILGHVYLNVTVSLEGLSRWGIAEFQELYISALARDGQVVPLHDFLKYILLRTEEPS